MPKYLAGNLKSMSCDSEAVSPDSTASGSSSSSTTVKPPPTPVADLCLEAIRRLSKSKGSISISDIRPVQRLGSGDIGSVYLAEIKGCCAGAGADERVFAAAKVMDKKELEERNKSTRAKTEREILDMLDHPFLPRLYGCAENDKLSCLLTEFCPGGDLHLLRQRQPAKRFDEQAVRFYASELVAALEYLHVLGIIYRDLKPENVLVRSDGHIMLTDFDLSLKSDFGCSPTAQLVAGSHATASPPITICAGRSAVAHCIGPAVSCFQPYRCTSRKKVGRLAGGMDFVAEPVDLRSMSFVGTHEYLAPEIVTGEGHGCAVDWWTLGVFMFELLYGVTPFKGSDEEATMANILARGLEFPKDPEVSGPARDLISGLLGKDPAKRLGAAVGAAAIKRHPFFSGVNWALLRCAVPPHVPPPFSRGVGSGVEQSDGNSSPEGAPVEYY
ncbi:Protein kinase G11A [Apostasia shenzhenica]|uniref:non-specific serine/threonine protein kinase n=1 Tax=Apostasia shenzhenica TaxID=1088818 RepID=A0A2I0AA79_9ASPA|nr:Protein kinase G11A [Apostasia shenzhenica]